MTLLIIGLAILFIYALIFTPLVVYNINLLEKEDKEIRGLLLTELKETKNRIWMLENPPKFKVGKCIYLQGNPYKYRINKIDFGYSSYGGYNTRNYWKYTLISCECNLVVEIYDERKLFREKPKLCI